MDMTESTQDTVARNLSGKSLANGLGVFSIGLGLVELLAPKTLARNLGMEGQEKLLQFYGLRELGVGLGILAAADPTPWIKGRIAGDMLDLGSLAIQLRPANPCAGQVGLALDRKSTRLNSSHVRISYAVFCLKKKICRQS